MPAPLSDAQKNRIQQYLHDGHRPAAISALEGVTDWSVGKITRQYRCIWYTYTSKGKSQARAAVQYTAIWLDDIRILVEQKPDVQLKEIQAFASNEWGVRFSIAHIPHTLKKMKISKRWRERVAAERAEECWERSQEGHTIQDAAFPTTSGIESTQI